MNKDKIQNTTYKQGKEIRMNVIIFEKVEGKEAQKATKYSKT